MERGIHDRMKRKYERLAAARDRLHKHQRVVEEPRVIIVGFHVKPENSGFSGQQPSPVSSAEAADDDDMMDVDLRPPLTPRISLLRKV
jgi:hypothetical protein